MDRAGAQIRILAGLIGALASSPFLAVSVLYLFELHQIRPLPTVPSDMELPHLVELGIWNATGEDPRNFHVEKTWPWTPVTDLLLERDPQRLSRPGWLAANQAAGVWLVTHDQASTRR